MAGIVRGSVEGACINNYSFIPNQSEYIFPPSKWRDIRGEFFFFCLSSQSLFFDPVFQASRGVENLSAEPGRAARARVPTLAQVGGLRRNVRIPWLSTAEFGTSLIFTPGRRGTRIISNLSTFTKETAVMAPIGSWRSHGTQHFKNLRLKLHILTAKLCHGKGGLQACAAGARYATFCLSPCCLLPFPSALD